MFEECLWIQGIWLVLVSLSVHTLSMNKTGERKLIKTEKDDACTAWLGEKN